MEFWDQLATTGIILAAFAAALGITGGVLWNTARHSTYRGDPEPPRRTLARRAGWVTFAFAIVAFTFWISAVWVNHG